MAARAGLCLHNGTEHADAVTEIHGEALDVVCLPSGVRRHDVGGPTLRLVGRIAKPTARHTSRDAFGAGDSVSQVRGVDMTRAERQCGSALRQLAVELPEQRVLHGNDEKVST